MKMFKTDGLIVPRTRMYWDLVVTVAIIICAFEIPYELCVEYSNKSTGQVFDLFFFVVFGIDILLNLRTVRTEGYGGLWGWRVIAGKISPRLSPEALEVQRGVPPRLLRTQPEVWRDYTRSGWFLIDLVATIPWGFLAIGLDGFGLARTLRLLRIARLIRLMRMTKGLRMLNVLRSSTQAFPALGRLITTLIALPWLAHMAACLLFWVEKDNKASDVNSYSEALYNIYIMLTSASPPEAEGTLTSAGYTITIFAVALSLLFVATAIGNLSALFSGMDSRKQKLHREPRSNHTLVLGWRPSIFSVIDQLIADDSGISGQIVILSNLNQEDMWRQIGEHCPGVEAGMLEVIEGQIGSVRLLEDLCIRNAARVVVLEYEDSAHHTVPADVRLLETLLACCQAIASATLNLQRQVGEKVGTPVDETGRLSVHRVPIVAAASNSHTATLLEQGIPRRLAEQVQIRVIDTGDLLDRILVQVINQPQIADVFRDLLSYEGDEEVPPEEDPGAEIYALAVDEQWVGARFDSLVEQFLPAIVIGYMSQDELQINPQPGSAQSQHVLTKADTIVLIADSMATVHLRANATEAAASSSVPLQVQADNPRSVIIMGPDAQIEHLTESLGYFLPAGSQVWVSWDTEAHERRGLVVQPLPAPQMNDEMSRDNGLGIVKRVQLIPDEVLSNCDTLVFTQTYESQVSHDAEILMALTAISARLEDTAKRPQVIVELTDRRFEELVKLFGDVSVLIPSRWASNLLVQLADAPYRSGIIAELLDPAGNELYMRRVSRYLLPTETELSFTALCGRARAHGEIVIGWVCPTEAQPHLAPHHRDTLLSDDRNQQLMVIAED